MIIVPDRIVFGPKDISPQCTAVRISTSGKVDAIASADILQKKYPKDDIVSYPGCTLMPGMIDMHVHLTAPHDPEYEYVENGQSLCALYTMSRMEQALRNGVTTIRDAYSSFGIGTALTRAVEDGYITIPRIIPCLRGICMVGGHGSDSINGVFQISGPEEGRQRVRENFAGGAKWIKVLTSDAYRGLELSQEELDAIVDEAHRLGMKAFAHAGYDPSMKMCIQAGFDSIEHGTHLTLEEVQTMKRNDQTWVPTVFVFNYVYSQVMGDNDSPLFQEFENDSAIAYLQNSVETYRKNLRTLYDTGVRIATGTDIDFTDYDIAAPVAQECRCLVECGLTPIEAMECATKNGAAALGFGDTLGQIKEGYMADLILVEGNPAEDITALQRIRATYQAGKCVFEEAKA